MTSHNKKKGFTLLELMVVLGILGVLGTISFPVISRVIPNYQLRAASRELVIEFKKAKMEAVKRGRTVLIEFTPETTGDPDAGGSYRVFVDMDESGDWTSGDLLLNTVSMPRNVRLPGGNQLTFTGNRFGYNSRGLPSQTGKVTLKKKIGTKSYEISLSVAGAVRLASI